MSLRFRWKLELLSPDGPTAEVVDERRVSAATQRLVACDLESHMSADGGSCFPSLDTIADETGLSKATVVLGIRALEATGWLYRQTGGGAKRPTRYQALIPDHNLLSRQQTDNRPTSRAELSAGQTRDVHERVKETDRTPLNEGSNDVDENRAHATEALGEKVG